MGPLSFVIGRMEDRLELRCTVLAKVCHSLLVVVGVGFWYLVLTQPRDWGGLVFLALCSVLAVGGLVASFRIRLTLSAKGIEARCFRSRAIEWDQVLAIDVSRGTRARLDLGGGGVVRTVLLLESGGRFRLPVPGGFMLGYRAQPVASQDLNRILVAAAARFGGRTVPVLPLPW